MSTPPQRSLLPKILDPRRLANQGVTLEGRVELSHCERLLAAVLEVSEPIEASLTFETAEQGRKVVRGHASTTVLLPCQRCLEAMPFAVETDIQVGVVWTEEEAKNLPRELDPWIVDTDTADLAALIEEEILLALPFVIYHPEDQCAGERHFSTDDEDVSEVNEGKENPFSILEQLKHRGSDH